MQNIPLSDVQWKKLLSIKVDTISSKELRYKASYRVRKWLYSGLPCVVCGDKNPILHHEDYTKPAEVVPMCGSCHHILHAYHNSYRYDKMIITKRKKKELATKGKVDVEDFLDA